MDLSQILELLPLLSQIRGAFDWANLGKVGLLQVFAWFLFATLGVVLHYFVDIRKGIIERGLFNYLVVDHLKATLQTGVAILLAAAAWFVINPIPAAWLPLFLAASTFGYTFDSMINKGKSTGI